MKKKINYMGLSELMRMIIIFVTFCLNKKKRMQNSDSFLTGTYLRVVLVVSNIEREVNVSETKKKCMFTCSPKRKVTIFHYKLQS